MFHDFQLIHCVVNGVMLFVVRTVTGEKFHYAFDASITL